MPLRNKLRLGAWFTLSLLLVLLIGAIISGLLLSRQLTNLAEDAVGSNGLLLLRLMNSVRAYTSGDIDPLVQPGMTSSRAFIPESVPAFSARAVVDQLRSASAYKDFVYKEASDNPTLPQDKADAFETQILMQFRKAPNSSQVTGFTQMNGQPVFYSAQPLVVSDQSCLACHSTPAAAPAAMVQRYGSTGGFGWQVGQVIAAQIVYVPAAEVYDQARRTWLGVMAIAMGAFVVAIVLLNILLRQGVLAPIQQMAALADRIGAGTVHENEGQELSPVAARSDELGQMARVFQRMAHEVYVREQSLRQQLQALRIEIDEVKKAHQVADLVETDSFQELRAKAQQFRQRNRPAGAEVAGPEDRPAEPPQAPAEASATAPVADLAGMPQAALQMPQTAEQEGPSAPAETADEAAAQIPRMAEHEGPSAPAETADEAAFQMPRIAEHEGPSAPAETADEAAAQIPRMAEQEGPSAPAETAEGRAPMPEEEPVSTSQASPAADSGPAIASDAIFEPLKQQLTALDRVDGVTPVEILVLPEGLQSSFRKLLKGNLTLSELAGELHVSEDHARQLADILVDKGFLQSEQRPEDGLSVFSVRFARMRPRRTPPAR